MDQMVCAFKMLLDMVRLLLSGGCVGVPSQEQRTGMRALVPHQGDLQHGGDREGGVSLPLALRHHQNGIVPCLAGEIFPSSLAAL